MCIRDRFYGKPADAPDDLPMFAEFRGGFPYAERSEVWSVHYSRAIENQLDVVHLPFVHPNTIGRGHKTLAVSYTHLDVYKRQGLPHDVVDAPALWMSTLPSDDAMPMEQFLSAPPKPPIAWPLKCASDTTKS